MRSMKLVLLSITMCMILVTSLMGACTSTEPETESTTTVTPEVKEPLKIGMSTPSTGVAAEKGAPMGHANLDCIKYARTNKI